MEDSITLIFVFIYRAVFKRIQYTQKIGKLPFRAPKNDEKMMKNRLKFWHIFFKLKRPIKNKYLYACIDTGVV